MQMGHFQPIVHRLPFDMIGAKNRAAAPSTPVTGPPLASRPIQLSFGSDLP